MGTPTTAMSLPTSVYGTSVFWERLWRGSRQRSGVLWRMWGKMAGAPR